MIIEHDTKEWLHKYSTQHIDTFQTEIEKSNTLKFQGAVHWLCCLQDLIEESQVSTVKPCKLTYQRFYLMI